MDSSPIVLETKVVAQSAYFAIEQVRVRFGNGEERIYERLREWKDKSVIVIALQEDGKMLLIREYACGIDRPTLALPKGMVNAGESELEAANRELMEEVGFGAKELVKLGEITLAPGHLCHKITVVFATRLYKRKLPGDEPERLEVVRLDLCQAEDHVVSGEIDEARTIAAIFMARNYLKKRPYEVFAEARS
jgi:ADP-ribose diphosphatase